GCSSGRICHKILIFIRNVMGLALAKPARFARHALPWCKSVGVLGSLLVPCHIAALPGSRPLTDQGYPSVVSRWLASGDLAKRAIRRALFEDGDRLGKHIRSNRSCSLRLSVRTSDFQSEKTGSTPVGSAIGVECLNVCVIFCRPLTEPQSLAVPV